MLNFQWNLLTLDTHQVYYSTYYRIQYLGLSLWEHHWSENMARVNNVVLSAFTQTHKLKIYLKSSCFWYEWNAFICFFHITYERRIKKITCQIKNTKNKTKNQLASVWWNYFIYAVFYSVLWRKDRGDRESLKNPQSDLSPCCSACRHPAPSYGSPPRWPF